MNPQSEHDILQGKIDLQDVVQLLEANYDMMERHLNAGYDDSIIQNHWSSLLTTIDFLLEIQENQLGLEKAINEKSHMITMYIAARLEKNQKVCEYLASTTTAEDINDLNGYTEIILSRLMG
jgi:hypothetical protein